MTHTQAKQYDIKKRAVTIEHNIRQGETQKALQQFQALIKDMDSFMRLSGQNFKELDKRLWKLEQRAPWWDSYH